MTNIMDNNTICPCLCTFKCIDRLGSGRGYMSTDSCSDLNSFTPRFALNRHRHKRQWRKSHVADDNGTSPVDADRLIILFTMVHCCY